MKVNFICNYRDDINDYVSKYKIDNYHNIEITDKDPEYYVIINNPVYKGKKQHYKNDKTVYIYNEPEITRKTWDIWKKKETFMYDNLNTCKFWQVNYNANELINLNIKKKEENKRKITCITTDLYQLEGHKLRVNFLKYIDLLEQVNITPKIYGRKKTGIYDQLKLKNYLGDVPNRDDVLLDYYYNFMGENVSEVNYFTEKIIDPILCETLCFYWGCPNIKNFLHEKSYIPIDLNRPQIAIKTIIDSINNNEYEKRLKYIKETKKKILYELNPMTLIQNNIIERN